MHETLRGWQPIVACVVFIKLGAHKLSAHKAGQIALECIVEKAKQRL
jgi:hypothetical protein